MIGKSGIRVFYHLFTVGEWQRILRFHLRRLRECGLYDHCERIDLGVVYRDRRALVDLAGILAGTKAVVSYSRPLCSLPQIWPRPPVRLTDGRFGEAETILRMVQDAKASADRAAYLFMHSKGVTAPRTTRRRHFRMFVDHGLPPDASDEAANDFVLGYTAAVATDWRDHLRGLHSGADYYYRLYNFFWASDRLLRGFDFERFLDAHRRLAPPQQRRHRFGSDWAASRHIFGLFPVKLHAFTRGVELSDPPHSYSDVCG